jgi:hypothetical protein
MSLKPRTTRRFLAFIMAVLGAVVVAQLAIPTWFSNHSDPQKKKRAPTRRPKGEGPRISGAPRSNAGDEQNPVDETLEVNSFDLPMVAAASFSGDVRDLTPVPTNLEQRSIDFEERLQELETPIGPEIGSTQTALQPSVDYSAGAGTAGKLSRLFRTEPVTGGNAGAGTPPDTNGDVGLNHYIISVNDAYGITTRHRHPPGRIH